MDDVLGLPRRELLRTAVAVAAITAGVAVVGWVVGLLLVGHVGPGAIQPLDGAVRRWVEDHSSTTDPLATGVDAVFGSAGCVTIAAVAGALVWARGRRLVHALVPLVVALCAGFVVFAVKAAIARPRPVLTGGIAVDDYSFPSGHATSFAALAVAMALLWLPERWQRAGWISTVVAVVVVAASRLVLGVHWFSDVAVGVALGVALAVGIVWACAPLARHDEAADPPVDAEAGATR